MQVRCVRAFGASVPGDLVEVPDGAAADPHHWEPADAPPPPAPPADPPQAVVPSFPATPAKEM